MQYISYDLMALCKAVYYYYYYYYHYYCCYWEFDRRKGKATSLSAVPWNSCKIL